MVNHQSVCTHVRSKATFILSQARQIPGITIFRSSSTVYFANAELYLEALKEKVCFFLWTIVSFFLLLQLFNILNQSFFTLFKQLFSQIISVHIFIISFHCQSGLDISKMIIYKRRQEAKQKKREKRAERRAKRQEKREVLLWKHLRNTLMDYRRFFCFSQTVFFSGETCTEGSEDAVWTGGLLCGGRGQPRWPVGQHVQRRRHRGQGGAGLDRKGEWDSVCHPDHSSNTGGPIQVGIPERRRPRLHQLGVDV